MAEQAPSNKLPRTVHGRRVAQKVLGRVVENIASWWPSASAWTGEVRFRWPRSMKKENAESWREFIKGMLAQRPQGRGLVTGDRCAGLVAAAGGAARARYQRCMVTFRRCTRQGQREPRLGGHALKAVFSMESRDKALEKAEDPSPGTWNPGNSRRPPNACAGASARPRPTCSTREGIGVGSAPTT